MEGRVAGIDADVIARSSSSLRDSRDESLHTEVEASDANWLFSPGLGSGTPNSFCIRVTARVYILFLFAYSPKRNWDHANIQVDEQDMHFSFL